MPTSAETWWSDHKIPVLMGVIRPVPEMPRPGNAIAEVRFVSPCHLGSPLVPALKGASRKSENCDSIRGTDLYDTFAVSRCC